MTDYPNYKSPAARQKDRIREDIAAIDKAIESCNPKLILQMHQHIDGKYQACIAGWTQSLYGYVPGYGINYEVIDVDDLAEKIASRLNMNIITSGAINGSEIKEEEYENNSNDDNYNKALTFMESL